MSISNLIMDIIVNLIYFLLISIVLFTLPGLILFSQSNYKFTTLEKVYLSSIVGFVSFTVLGYFLLFLKLEWLLLIIVALVDIWYIKKTFSATNSFRFKKIAFQPHKSVILLFLLGVLLQLAVIFPSGSIINGDLLFWSAHGHDGIWHVALTEELKKGLPAQSPVFGGEKLVNYHFFSDISSAFMSKYFGLSSFDLYFKFFPILFSIWLGLSSYLVGKKLGQSSQAGFWSVFFVYFSGSFGFLITMIRNQTIAGESLFWGSQVQSSSGNPPQIVAFIILLAIVYLLTILFEQKSRFISVITILLIGSLIEFKVYGSIILFFALGIVSLLRILKYRRFDLFFITIISGLVSLSLFVPNISNAGGFLIYEPGWFIRTMIVSTDKLDWLDLERRRLTYLHFNNYKWVILYWVFGFFVLLVGNLGTKLIGLWSFLKLFKKPTKSINQLLILMSFFAVLLPMLFLQKGVAANTIQFLQYFLLFFCLFAGITLTNLLQKIKQKTLRQIIILLIIILSIPTQIGLVYHFYFERSDTSQLQLRSANAKISALEIQALNYLKQTSPPDSIILSFPYNRYYRNTNPAPPPIWAWSDTAYISAISNRRTFVSDIEQLDIMAYNYKPRQTFQEKIFKETYITTFVQELKNQKINYLYLTNQEKMNFDLTTNQSLKLVYQNPEVQIWQIN